MLAFNSGDSLSSSATVHEFWRNVFKEMSPGERLGRRIIGSFALGVFATLANIALDIFVSRRDGVHATNTLNDFLGLVVALLGYAWVSRGDSKQALELSTERLMREAIDNERKRIALEIMILSDKRSPVRSCTWNWRAILRAVRCARHRCPFAQRWATECAKRQ